MFAVISPPVPAAVAPAEPAPSKGELKRQRQRALAGVDPTGDLLPLELTGKAYGDYRQKLWHRDPHCIFCGRQLKHEDATLDHALPKAQGGLNQPWNLWLSCQPCNNVKGNRSALEWLNDLINACIEMGLIREDDEVHVEFDEAAEFHAQFDAEEIGGVA